MVRKPTIRDIARIAGVSRSTVSLVINDDPRISAETKARVNQVIAKAGYEPNSMARGLARRRSDTIAVILPQTVSHVFADYYFAEAISGISAALSAAGYRLLIELASDRFVGRGEYRKLLREGGADGLLLLGITQEDSYVLELIEEQAPVVLVNSRLSTAAAVVADNRAGARAMVRSLVELGHRGIGFIGGLELTTVGEDRSLGFLDGLRDAGLSANPALKRWGNFSEASGEVMARELLAQTPRPTAIMAANDMMAIGALRVAQEEFGLGVPGDLTIVGADDVRLTTYVTPRLTTVTQDIYAIGERATRLLLAALESKEVPRGIEVIPTRVVKRESSGPPRIS